MNPDTVVNGLAQVRAMLRARLERRGIAPGVFDDSDSTWDGDPAAAEARLLVDRLAVGLVLREVMREALQ